MRSTATSRDPPQDADARRCEAERTASLRRARRSAERHGLAVAHTHPHADHVAGDGQFAGRPNTVVVGHSVDEVAAFFGLGAAEPTGRAITTLECVPSQPQPLP